MKQLTIILLFLLSITEPFVAQSGKTFDIFSYNPPPGYKMENNSDFLFYSKTEGVEYCQLFLYPAGKGLSDVEKDFEVNWNFFARNASQGVDEPQTLEKTAAEGWQVQSGASSGNFDGKQFVLSLTTFTKSDITFYTAAVFTQERFLQDAEL